MEKIANDASFVRIAGWVNSKIYNKAFAGSLSHDPLPPSIIGTFMFFSPLLYYLYWTAITFICQELNGQRPPFKQTVFGSFTVNFGPRTMCVPHLDPKNVGFGWCAVTALGQYDPSKGGHLILWDLKLILEFPPGTTILLPSAVLWHSNTEIQEHETRYGLAMYTQGDVLRWACSKKRDNKNNHRAAPDDGGRWARGYGLLCSLEDLRWRQFEEWYDRVDNF